MVYLYPSYPAKEKSFPPRRIPPRRVGPRRSLSIVVKTFIFFMSCSSCFVGFIHVDRTERDGLEDEEFIVDSEELVI